MTDDEIVTFFKDDVETERKKFPELMERIKNGKRWLTENRLEVLQARGLGKAYDFQRWTNNLNIYWDLAEEAYNKMLMTANEIDLFHPLFIEDLYPTLQKIFPERRLEDVIDK